MSQLFRCKACNQERPRIRAERKVGPRGSFHYYRDDMGRRWNGFVCPACHVVQTRIRSGHVSRDESKNEIVRKGRAAELLAKRYFEARGYSVILCDGKGPDLTLFDERGNRKRCEVKSANLHHNCSMRVCAVREKRKTDDLVAIVFPSGAVHVEPMSDHLQNCDKSGSRTVTSLWRQYAVAV